MTDTIFPFRERGVSLEVAYTLPGVLLDISCYSFHSGVFYTASLWFPQGLALAEYHLFS